MIITQDCVKFIKLQRTNLTNSSDKSVCKSYEKNINDDYAIIKKFLPASCDGILDIGCGLAGIDTVLYNHYNGTINRIHLIDREGETENIYYGYRHEASKYNSFSTTLNFLNANLVPLNKVLTVNADLNGFEAFLSKSYDIIISLISCGFHYPIGTYLDLIRKSISQNGVCFFDIRRRTDQIETLRRNFSRVEIIYDFQNYERVCVSNVIQNKKSDF